MPLVYVCLPSFLHAKNILRCEKHVLQKWEGNINFQYEEHYNIFFMFLFDPSEETRTFDFFVWFFWGILDLAVTVFFLRIPRCYCVCLVFFLRNPESYYYFFWGILDLTDFFLRTNPGSNFFCLVLFWGILDHWIFCLLFSGKT